MPSRRAKRPELSGVLIAMVLLIGIGLFGFLALLACVMLCGLIVGLISRIPLSRRAQARVFRAEGRREFRRGNYVAAANWNKMALAIERELKK